MVKTKVKHFFFTIIFFSTNALHLSVYITGTVAAAFGIYASTGASSPPSDITSTAGQRIQQPPIHQK